MHRHVACLSLLLCVAFACAQTAAADTLTWSFDNETDAEVSLEFYSQDRDQVWPGDDQVYLIAPGDGAQSYALDCTKAETICYGAWQDGDGVIQWGRGYNDRQSCEDCCAICGGGLVDPVEFHR